MSHMPADQSNQVTIISHRLYNSLEVRRVIDKTMRD